MERKGLVSSKEILITTGEEPYYYYQMPSLFPAMMGTSNRNDTLFLARWIAQRQRAGEGEGGCNSPETTRHSKKETMRGRTGGRSTGGANRREEETGETKVRMCVFSSVS